MKTILTGIQPTGKLHIGNYFGAIKPALELSKTNNTILFIADIHSLTTILDAKTRQDNTYSLLSALIALGYDFKKNILFKQSDVSEVCELMYYLACLTPTNNLDKAHAFKEKINNHEANTGLYTYPVLMAADILLYGTDSVPVGKDQMQHIEIARTLANKFNVIYGNTFNVPQPYIIEKAQTVIGTDGRKMSKSYNNTINPFDSPADLKKVIYKIPTSSARVDEPKDPETCNVFKLLSLFSFESEMQDMRKKYENGVSYSEVKKLLLDKIVEEFSEERDIYNKIINQKNYLDSVLIAGKLKAREIATSKITEVKNKLGL